MADSPIRSAGPVNATSGFAGRAGGQALPKAPAPAAIAPRAADRVSVVHGTSVALRLLRERVLARTRSLLELGEEGVGPEFAEILAGEPVTAFVGRLLSAQNQLAARRVPAWPQPRIRATLDTALRDGVAETRDLFTAAGTVDATVAAVLAEVMAEYERRLVLPVAGEHDPRA